MKEIGLFVRSVMIVNDQNQVEYIEIVENTHTEPNYDNVLKQLKRKWYHFLLFILAPPTGIEPTTSP